MRTIVLAILTLGLIASLGSAANAADLSRDRSYGKRAHVSRAAADWPRLRVVEQVPYCGDCDNLIGRPSAPYVRLHYIGYLPWNSRLCPRRLLRGLQRLRMLLAGSAGRRWTWRLGSQRREILQRGPLERALRPRQTSTLAANALSWMNCRRGSTRSPINWSKSTLASSTSLIRTCNNERALVSSVVSHNCSGFISPRPL